MKKAILALLILLMLPSIVLITYAHPGRTDSRGGHTNHSTGEYHYHHGYSAHDHYDIDGDGDVDCPYDFDDQTRSNRGNSSNNSNNNSKTETKSTNRNSADTTSKVLLSLFVLFPVALLLTMPVMSIVSYILSFFGAELSDKIFYFLMYAVYFWISGYLIYLIIIW